MGGTGGADTGGGGSVGGASGGTLTGGTGGVLTGGKLGRIGGAGGDGGLGAAGGACLPPDDGPLPEEPAPRELDPPRDDAGPGAPLDAPAAAEAPEEVVDDDPVPEP